MSTFSRLHMYLTADSKLVEGESADAGYPDQIELSSVSWDIGRGKAEGTDRGKVEPGLFEFSKPMDKASIEMLNHLKNGKPLKAKVVLASHPDPANPASSDHVLTFELTNVRIVEYKIDGSDGEKSGEVKEDWTFTYSELHVGYKQPGVKEKTSDHQRLVETTSKSDLEAILAKFATVKSTDMIGVVTKLESLYKSVSGTNSV